MTKNFKLSEFDCNDTARTKVPAHLWENTRLLAAQLQVIRDYVGSPIKINSAYRTEAYNRSVGGSPRSQHLIGKAADITTANHTPKQLLNIIKKLIREKKILNGGLGLYPNFCHYDIFYDGKRARRWQIKD